MDETKTFYLCVECSKDIYLKNYVNANAKSNEICMICLDKRRTLNISDDSEIIDFCRFLIRYHFPEYEYNTHWGGDNLPHQFYSDNPIISHQFADLSNREIEVEEFLYELFDISNYDSNIELYYGHDENGRGLFPEAIKSVKSNTWRTYKEELQKKNFYLLEGQARETFAKLLDSLTIKIHKGENYFRARIGYKEKAEEIGTSSVKIKVPFSEDELSAPPILKAKAGRANRQGVAFLYLASDSTTAFGEIRPHPGHYVSYGEFTSQIELTVADLRFIDLMKFYRDENKLQLFKLLKDLSDELSIPILPEEQKNYLVTQFISDVIRQLGFDGILFNSSVSTGHNLVAFNKDNFVFKAGSSKLIKVTSVEFGYKPIEYHIDNFFERAIEK